MKDQMNHLYPKRVISPVSVADTTAQVGQIIDRAGFGSLTYVIATGSIADADATFTVLLEEGDASNLSDNAAVADADMVSMTAGTAPETAAAFTFADDAETRAIGYIGSKRYIRLTVTPVANTGNQYLAGIAILEGKAPAFNQLAASAN